MYALISRDLAVILSVSKPSEDIVVLNIKIVILTFIYACELAVTCYLNTKSRS